MPSVPRLYNRLQEMVDCVRQSSKMSRFKLCSVPANALIRCLMNSGVVAFVMKPDSAGYLIEIELDTGDTEQSALLTSYIDDET